MTKIITWILTNGASVLGIIQAIIKGVKEILTSIINVLSLIIPTSKAQAFVMKFREWVNKIDTIIENIKVKLLPK